MSLFSSLTQTGGLFMLSLVSFFLKDLKKIIAYSSITHMILAVNSIFSIKIFSFNFSLIILICHGIISPLIFKFADLRAQEIGSRNIELLKGTQGYKIFLIWFLIIIWNMSCPPRINLLAEILLFFISGGYHKLFFFIIITSLIISSCFNIRLLIAISGQKKTEC